MGAVGQQRDGHGQRRFWLETLLCYLFLVCRVFTVSRFSTLFVAFITFAGLGQAHADVRVLTSIKPLQQIAAAVQEGVGSPDVLLPPGASPHHYALRPSDVRRVADADLLYWIGPDMENFLPRVLGTRSKPSVAVQSLPQMQLRHFGEDSHSHEQAHEDAHQAHDGHDHDHRPGSLDAHLWLSSANARIIAARMAQDLAAADPANASRYQGNLQAFTQRLDSLDQRIRTRVAKVAGKPYFVFHEAFDYFEATYGLKHTGVFSVASEVQPGAQHVAAMRKRLQEVGKTCVFSEPPLRPRLAETLTAGLPVRLAELDALGGTETVDAHGYEQLLENLGNDLANCLEQL
ncbi:zinc ABC transporter substrate-binding protein ZnuA [Pseudomonas capeferrum]|nr:zinc ABC transporter substrate-binding protein ZnuA [Pseudomonas capeferrum]